MGVHTHLPSEDWRNDGWALVGSGVTKLFHALSALADDTKYIKSPASKSGATVRFPVDITNVPEGAVITSVTVKLRCATGTGSAPAGTSPSITIAVAAEDDTARFTTRTIYPTSTITTFEVATYQRDALGLLWDIHRLNHILCRVFSYVGVLDLIRCYEFYTEVKFRVRPTITVDAPSGTVYTPSPVISWTYSQTDGDPQAKVEYKLFTAVQVSAVSFNPETDPPVYSAVLEGDVSSVTLPTSINPDTYWVYVRSTSSFKAKSVWVGKQFTVSGPAPGSPGVPDPTGAAPAGTGVIEVVPDSDAGSATLTLRDTSNLLSVQESDAETSTDGHCLTTTNCAVVRDTSTAFPGGTASWKMTSTAGGDMSIASDWVEVSPDNTTITARGQFKSAVSARSARVRVLFYDSAFAAVSGTLTGSSVTDATGTWTEAVVTGAVPAGTVFARAFFDVLSTGGASEVHNVDRLGLMYGTSTPYSDGGLTSRNLLSSWYSTAEGTAGAGESWLAGGGSSTTTIAPPGTGASGSLCHKMTYTGVVPSIGLRAAGTNFTSPTSGSDFTLNKPAGTAVDDLMLAFVSCSEWTTINPPAGWTLVDTARVDDGTTDTALFVLKRTATGSEPASWTDGTLGTSALRRSAIVVGYSGAADVSSQMVASAVGSSGNATPLYLTTPTINNTDPNAWRVSAFALNDNATGGSITANTMVPSVIPAISYVGNSGWYTYSGGTGFTILKPSGVVEGDFMIAVIGAAANCTITPPAGWTARYTGTGTTGPYTQCILTRHAGASEPSSWTGSVSVAVDALLVVNTVAYRNVNATTPFINQSGTTANSTNQITTPSVSNTNSLAWRVCAFGHKTSNSGADWTSSETTQRLDAGAYVGGGFFGPPFKSVMTAVFDSNGSVSTGSHSRVGYQATSFSSASAWIGILNPLGTPPTPPANETARANTAVGSSDPWLNTRVFDSNGVVAAGSMSVTGTWAPGSGSDLSSIAGWVGLIRPAAPVVAGYVSAAMATKVDVSSIKTDLFAGDEKVAVCASFIGSTAGTPYLTANFYRANVLLGSSVAQGVPFGASVWVKSYATFDVPEGTTRMTVGVSVSDRAVSDVVYFDRVSLAYGSSDVYRPGTSRAEHAVWSKPMIEYTDDDGTGYRDWLELPGTTANPPAFDPLSGLTKYEDHTVIPLTNRKYRAKTLVLGLAGDQFVSAFGPDSPEFSFEAENWWLKDISDPTLNIELKVKWDTTSIGTTNTATVFQPLGEDLPVVLTEGYKGDTFTLSLIPVSHDNWVQLKKLLRSGKTLFLQSDIDHAWWVRPVGDLSGDVLPTGSRQSNPLREVKISFIQVAPIE